MGIWDPLAINFIVSLDQAELGLGLMQLLYSLYASSAIQIIILGRAQRKLNVDAEGSAYSTDNHSDGQNL
jgi:hypothetical protein